MKKDKSRKLEKVTLEKINKKNEASNEVERLRNEDILIMSFGTQTRKKENPQM